MFSRPFICLCHPLAPPSPAFSPWFHAHPSMPPPLLLPLAQSPKRIQPFLTWTLSSPAAFSSCSLQNTYPPVSRPCLCLFCHSSSCPFLYSSFILNEDITYSAVCTRGSLTFFEGKEGMWLPHCPVLGVGIELPPSP